MVRAEQLRDLHGSCVGIKFPADSASPPAPCSARPSLPTGMGIRTQRAPAPVPLTSDALHGIGAGTLTARYRSGELSPVAVIEAVLARITAIDGRLGAFAHLDEQGARSAAQASAERWRQGSPAGLLDGVPVSLKDLLAVAGLPSRRGSRATTDGPAAEDSPGGAVTPARCRHPGHHRHRRVRPRRPCPGP